ncbi:hypothetical protein C8J57DRAFT_1248474 [Mycena rebaudengoi]|nr:hypothetical protein C8J57DRAFT_1248474 [Mycena rebaudengoi]
MDWENIFPAVELSLAAPRFDNAACRIPMDLPASRKVSRRTPSNAVQNIPKTLGMYNSEKCIGVSTPRSEIFAEELNIDIRVVTNFFLSFFSPTSAQWLIHIKGYSVWFERGEPVRQCRSSLCAVPELIKDYSSARQVEAGHWFPQG